MARRATIGAAAALVAAAVTAGCGSPSPSGYEQAAVTAAQGALSPLQSARLAVSTAERGRVPGPYLTIVLRDSAEATATARGEFAGQVPPGGRPSQRLRTEALALLDEADGGTLRLRALVEQDRRADAARAAADLAPTADRLARFIEEHRR